MRFRSAWLGKPQTVKVVRASYRRGSRRIESAEPRPCRRLGSSWGGINGPGMSLSIGNLRGDGLIPPAAVDFLKRRGIEAAGLVLAGLALAFVVALLSFDPGDPSLNSASDGGRSEEHTSELQSLMRISYAVFCL